MDLSTLPAVDAHAHPILRIEAARRLPYPAFFTEGSSACAPAAASTLFYRRSLRDLASLFQCEPKPESILAAQDAMGAELAAAACFAAANLACVLLDDGYPIDDAMSEKEMGHLVPVRRVLRLERLAEVLIASASDRHDFEQRLRAALETADVVALKSVAAYRCGLHVNPSRGGAVDFAAAKRSLQDGRGRLTDRGYIELVLFHGLEEARRRRLPVQFHCGFGDADLSLPEADPALLKGVVEAWPAVQIVLLHGYPFARRAGWMASVYPNVHVDVGLAIPFLSTRGMRAHVEELLHMSPLDKVMYSSDASRIAELYYLGGLHGRRVLGHCLERAVSDRDLSAVEAEDAARRILADNARQLYGL